MGGLDRGRENVRGAVPISGAFPRSSGKVHAARTPWRAEGSMRAGDVVQGRFEVEMLAGSGGAGQVFRAHDKQEE